MYPSTSCLMILPLGPDPFIADKSIPFYWARVLARGLAITRSPEALGEDWTGAEVDY